MSDMSELAADLGRVPKNVGPFLNSAAQFTASRIKKDAARSVGGGRWSAAAAAIDYEVKTGGGNSLAGAIGSVLAGSALASVIDVEIGYNKGKAGGPLGNIREFGAPGKDTAPSNDLVNALESNQGDFERGVEKAISDALRKAGL